MQSFPADNLIRSNAGIAEQLRKTIQRIGILVQFAVVLPATAVDQLEHGITAPLLPKELCERHAWLFGQWVELPGFRDDYPRMEEEVARLRVDALREILDQDGFGGVLKLAKTVESPGQVGATLRTPTSSQSNRFYLDLLRSSNDKYVLLAGAYARDRIFRAGWDWVRSLSLDKWDAKDAAALLSQAGIDPQAWSFAESLGEDVFREYWNTVPAYNRLDQQQLEFACQRLLEADRPEIAIGTLSRVASAKPPSLRRLSWTR